MKRLLLIFTALALELSAQIPDYKKAPNSYIYDTELAQSNNYGGIMIPVKKAYEMWANYVYLKTNGVSTPIPPGTQTASLYWEDVPGLISQVSIVPGATPDASKIKVNINKGRGKGNAVVAFKVNGTIFWSWHIWVTDNPSNGATYSQGYEADIDLKPITMQYMDRNLGAVASGIVGNDWQKTSGLFYEWGRKDPFPGLVYKDNDFYEITGEVGTLRHKQIDPVNTIPVKIREFNEIEKNIQYSVLNPISYIINTDAAGNWFSSSRFKYAGTNSTDYVTWDLWSDNAKGANSNANSSSTILKNESRSYELKSELDPCPNGWRVPSYYGRVTTNNNLSPWGRGDWSNDDSNAVYRQLFPDSQNGHLNGIAVYPGVGMDFTKADNGFRNMGTFPITGGYVYYPNSVAPNAPVGITYQDQNASSGYWSATFAYDGARLFSIVSDPARTSTTVGLHAVYINQTNPTRSGNPVRCMKDPNILKIGDFVTEYFANPTSKAITDYIQGLNNPNTYVAVNQNLIKIPVSKAFSVYNQLLSDHGMLDYSALVSKVLWTTNSKMVTKISMDIDAADARNSYINVELNPAENGNAVISLHNGDTKNPAYWSWLIWAPKEDPSQNAISYLTEDNLVSQYNFINPTASKLPPMLTTFLDRNVGAVESLSSNFSQTNADASKGLHFQWGRKDAIPSFAKKNNVSTPIYLGSENSSLNGLLAYTVLNDSDYQSAYTIPYTNYGSTSTITAQKLRENILASVQNPLSFLYQSGTGALYDGGNHFANDLTKIRDWVSEKNAAAPERWGHGGKKSAFDPCPEGWRVPDVSFTNLYTGSKGSSPWYNGYANDSYGKLGVIQDQWQDVATNYYGRSSASGWIFENPTYRIGNFANDGIRGEIGNNALAYDRSGVWTASLGDMRTGFALAMEFQGSKMQTGTGAYPQAGMGVRCAKDESRILGVTAVKIPSSVLSTANPNSAAKEVVEVYPNPFHSEINVNSEKVKSFEIFDMGGRKVLSGAVKYGKIKAENLSNGVYLLKITKNDGSTDVKKIIKN